SASWPRRRRQNWRAAPLPWPPSTSTRRQSARSGSPAAVVAGRPPAHPAPPPWGRPPSARAGAPVQSISRGTGGGPIVVSPLGDSTVRDSAGARIAGSGFLSPRLVTSRLVDRIGALRG